MEKRCISCNTSLLAREGSASFPCPNCDDVLSRCGKCRKIGRKYICKCGFEGP